MTTVQSNNQWRDFLETVPEKIMSDFDHLSDSDAYDGWILYRGVYYHLSDFMSTQGFTDEPVAKWHGYAGDSFFSGVVIRVSDDGEQYQIGTYLS